MKFCKKIVPLILTIAILFAFTVPASAIGIVGALELATLGDWCLDQLEETGFTLPSWWPYEYYTCNKCELEAELVVGRGGIITKATCPTHGVVSLGDCTSHRTTFGEHSTAVPASSSAVFGGGAGRSAYNDYVTALPADNINSQGLSDFYITGWIYSFPSETSKVVAERTDALGFECISGPATSGYLHVGALSGTFTVPVDGTYRIVVPLAQISEGFQVGLLGLFSIVDGVHTRVALKNVHNSSVTSSSGSSLYVTSASSSAYYFVDVVLSKSVSYRLSSVDDSYSTVLCDQQFSFNTKGAYQTLKLLTRPYIQGMDLVSTAPIGSYASDTRTGSLAGNFGYYGDDGKLIAAENVHIVNETDNSVFNPVTQTTTNFTNWDYDYSTRTYTVTLDSGTKQYITYGDEQVTIKEGDTIYNVYYVTDGSTTPPVTCVHDYTSSVTTAATCTVAGLNTLTCSKCSKTTTERVPATGHTWVVSKTVSTSYDETGELVQQGYTIYKCSVCGEEYKDTGGTGPPAGGGPEEDGKESIWDKIGGLLGSVGNIFVTVIEAAFMKVFDALTALVDAINAKLESVLTAIFGLFDRIPQLFGGFTAFLAAVFPFFPQEVFDILTLSVLVLAMAALIKFFLKR